MLDLVLLAHNKNLLYYVHFEYIIGVFLHLLLLQMTIFFQGPDLYYSSFSTRQDYSTTFIQAQYLLLYVQ